MIITSPKSSGQLILATGIAYKTRGGRGSAMIGRTIFLVKPRKKTSVYDSTKSYLVTASFCKNRCQEVTVTVSKNELKIVLDKLDTVKLELLRLRAMLLPEEEASEEEKKEIENARKEIAKGSKISLEDLVKELNC
jgi:hypothetical protein